MLIGSDADAVVLTGVCDEATTIVPAIEGDFFELVASRSR
jgi:hypothetical protein